MCFYYQDKWMNKDWKAIPNKMSILLLFFEIIYFILSIWIHFLYICMYTVCVCLRESEEGVGSPGTQALEPRIVWAIIWVLGPELKCF